MSTATGAVPRLTLEEAEAVGALLRGRQARAGGAPALDDDLGWADVVQFVLYRARETVATRTARS